VTYLGGFVGAYETDGWERIASVDLAPADYLTLVGFSADGSALHVVSGFAGPAGGGLHWLDGGTLRPTRAARERIHEGSVKSVALSQDASLIATGSSDGLARVWDARSGDLVHEIVVRDAEVQGLAFVDRTRLAITRRDDGALRVYTLDGDELVRLTRASLTRTFTEVECARYGIDPCPTLEELRRG
jgi:WD40 repeat protein